MDLADFVDARGPHLRHAFVAAYGLELGDEAYSAALEYASAHWERLAAMVNPMGYLYRVGQSATRRVRRRKPVMLPRPPTDVLPDVEPGLVPALESLSEMQRVVVLLVVAFDWKQSEVAELTGLSHSSVRTHLARSLAALQKRLKVDSHVG